MIKKILVLVSAMFSSLCFAQAIVLPNLIIVNRDNPGESFPKDVQQYFAISANLHNIGCANQQEYILTILLYRNYVDNKVVSTYRARDDNNLCWVDLISYSDKLLPDLNAGGWKPPEPGANTWCSRDGLRNPSLCPILDNI